MKLENTDTVAMYLIMSGDHSGFEQEHLLKIDSRLEFEEFFGKINRTRKPGIPVPEIDFKTKSVIVRLKGTTTNNEPDITLQKSSKESLLLKKIRTNSRKETTAVLTPFFIYSVPKTNKDVIIQ
ncbi:MULTISPECIES: hypothetical protein [Maribacter]|uniref:Uncharacterized protein n=1 Tax=Maribacter flavus TaxID=1658664 RepID=A0A5B2TPT7_9FLAO|nr:MULTISPECIES: hypothetical protein [Maribacter]KAA2215590.1 hypothetical protein F0361_18325 [Maribacter flavus]MDC6406911.1 hypothetical protein [Maribacter sp. PR66]MEE1974026.1 hypothetical protein [Maribacter flavus]